jgi:hypothetical protein
VCVCVQQEKCDHDDAHLHNSATRVNLRCKMLGLFLGVRSFIILLSVTCLFRPAGLVAALSQ